MTRLLVLDPGGTTGWSLWSYDALTPLQVLEYGQVAGGVKGFVSWWQRDVAGGPIDEVLAETFRLDGRTPKPNVEPLKIEGALEVLWPGWFGQANVMKAHAPDDLLKRHDLWWRGQQHARDTARHAIALMKVRRHAPTLRRFFPPREGV